MRRAVTGTRCHAKGIIVVLTKKIAILAPGGAGVASHLAGKLFKSTAGIDIVHVPYKGQAPATADLLGGQVSFMFNNPITSLPHIKSDVVKWGKVVRDSGAKAD
jgi:tripartite-type tricarboxylate transporter receptor subunit TctC